MRKLSRPYRGDLNMKNHLIAFFVVIVIASSPLIAFAEDLALVNRPVNTTGLTGILFTTAPYTLTPGIVEVGASILAESSEAPDFTITEYPLSVTVGMPHNAEFTVRGSYIHIKEGPTGTAPVDRRTGDLEVLYKWNFLPQAESPQRPSFAIILGGALPTGTNTDMKIDAVNHWGLTAGIAAGAEISWRDHTIGVYADGKVKGLDPVEKRIRDIYEIYNAGLLFPISKYQNLQMLLEYTVVQGRDRKTLDGGDYSAVNYGLRLVGERFNLTVGTQILRKQAEGYDKSERVLALLSLKF